MNHIVFSAVPAWGHTRPFCILAARLVHEHRDIVITMLVAPNFLEKVDRELLAELEAYGDFKVTIQRVRVLSTFQSSSDSMFELFAPLAQTYGAAYEVLVREKPIVCAMRGTVYDPVPAPKLVILDTFEYAQWKATRAISGDSVPIMAWVTGHASGIFRQFGPESMGGLGDIGPKIDAEAARLGVAPEEIGDKASKCITHILNYTDGTLIQIPGLPLMYDYEFFPQKLPFGAPISSILKDCYKLLEACDGALLTTVYAYEKESLEALKSWFSDRKKSTFVIGPLLPLGFGTAKQRPKLGADKVGEFLDRMLLEWGEQSVLFISFGTAFFPSAPEYLEEVIEALIESNVPFIFCFASPFANVSNSFMEKIQSSGVGLLIKWAPQQFVLSHPATGWFLSHGGQNSVLESLACGIPFILWPFQADQPGAAAHLSENLQVGFELVEVRTGDHALKPMYRHGRAARGTREAVGIEIRKVLRECRGPKGDQMRRNAEELKKKFAQAWDDEGPSRKELQTFLDQYL